MSKGGLSKTLYDDASPCAILQTLKLVPYQATQDRFAVSSI